MLDYYTLQRTLKMLKESLNDEYTAKDIATLCRQGILTPVFAYNRYCMEILEYYYDSGKPEQPSIGRRPEPMTTHFYDGYLTDKRLLSLLDKSVDKLELFNAMTYKSDGSGCEIELVANALNVRKYLNSEEYSVYSDNDHYTVTRESLLFPSEQVQSYIASRQIHKQHTPEQQRIADLENQLAQAKAQLVDKPADGTLLTVIHDKSHEHHAPDLSHAIKLWSELYIDGLIGSDSHSNKSNKWIQQNTSYGDNTEDSSVKRLRQVSTPLKDFGGQRKR